MNQDLTAPHLLKYGHSSHFFYLWAISWCFYQLHQHFYYSVDRGIRKSDTPRLIKTSDDQLSSYNWSYLNDPYVCWWTRCQNFLSSRWAFWCDHAMTFLDRQSKYSEVLESQADHTRRRDHACIRLNAVKNRSVVFATDAWFLSKVCLGHPCWWWCLPLRFDDSHTSGSFVLLIDFNHHRCGYSLRLYYRDMIRAQPSERWTPRGSWRAHREACKGRHGTRHLVSYSQQMTPRSCPVCNGN